MERTCRPAIVSQAIVDDTQVPGRMRVEQGIQVRGRAAPIPHLKDQGDHCGGRPR